MPYTVVDNGEPGESRYCVYKKDEDGEPEGKSLGCHPTREKAEAQIAAIWANESKTVSHKGWYALKAMGEWELEVLGVPFGGPDGGKDADGQFFSPKTDLMLKIGEKRPVLYNHGYDPENEMEFRPEVIGEAEYIRVDSRGHWFRVVLNQASSYAKRIMDAARVGLARASSGAVNYLTRIMRQTGEIAMWPFSELTLIDKEPGKREPANEYAVAHLKAAFKEAGIELPEVFAEGGEPKAETAKVETPVERVRINPEYLAEARRITRAGGQHGSQ